MNSNNFTNDLSQTKQQAIQLCQSGQFSQAKDLLNNLQQRSNLDAESLSMLGGINGQLGKFDEAVDCFSKAVNLQPSALQGHIGHGKALVMLGRHSEAEISFKKVLGLKPDFAPAHQELATVYLGLGDMVQAEVCLIRALELDPKSEVILLELGRFYSLWNKPDFALNYFNRVIDVNKNNVEALHNLGRINLNKAQVEVAENYFNRAIQLNRNYIQAYVDLGYLLLNLNRIQEAEATYDKALALQPDNIEVLVGRAKVFEQSGDFKSVNKCVMPLIDKGIKHPDVGVLFAKNCRHYDLCDKAVEYLEGMLSGTDNMLLRDSKLHFALGKLYDSMGQYDQAFLHFKKGNDIKVDTFNKIEHTGSIDRLIEVCDWNFFLSAPRSTQLTERPVFIVGMPRSGTTLTEQILCSHPDVYGAGEIAILPNIIMNLPKYLGEGLPYPDNLKNLTTEILDDFAKTYLDEINKLDDKAPRTLDKTLVNFLYLGLIPLMFPNAKIIHCKRDPRDTCLSIYFQNFDDSHNYSTKLENLGFYYNEYEKLMKHWKSILKIPIMEVQYEDMVKDQEKLSRELIDFVGLEWDESVLKFYENKRSVVTASYDQVRQKIYTKSTARWKNYEKHIEPLVKALSL